MFLCFECLWRIDLSLWSFTVFLSKIQKIIESLEEGHCYDKRHSFKTWKFEPCSVIIFITWTPDREIFSEVRWVTIEL